MAHNSPADGTSLHGVWASRWLFILAATGSAVGLGNIWKFPYITGVYGGGAFVLVYLLSVMLVGVPIMVAEIMMGRRARAAPGNAVRILAEESGGSRRWAWFGYLWTFTGFLILSYYSMIAGWALWYIVLMAKGALTAATPDAAQGVFAGLQANPLGMTLWHTVFMAMTVYVVARGVKDGLERAVRWMMPLLGLLLVALVGYSMTTGHFMDGVHFLFDVDFSKLSGQAVMVAMGHSFFTLSIGMGAIMAYGAYVPREQSIGAATLAIAGMDTLFAIFAGLAIFPIVFAHGLAPDQGPGLMFVTLPLAFGGLPLGSLFGALFFVLVVIAAWTSSISIAEPFVAWAVEKGMSRMRAAVIYGAASWLLGLFSILSFNVLSGPRWQVHGKSFFGALDFVASNVLLPCGGLLVAVFAGWVMKDTKVMKELAMKSHGLYIAWRIAVRIVAPLGILAVLLNSLGLF